MNKKISPTPPRLASTPWKRRFPNFASTSGTRVSANRLRDVAGPVLLPPGVMLSNGSRNCVPSIAVAFDRTTGTIVGWEIAI